MSSATDRLAALTNASFENGGHRDAFVPALHDVATVGNDVAAQAVQAAADATAAAGDRAQTGLDRTAAASSASAAAASVPATADRTIGRHLNDTSIWSMVRATTRWTINSAGGLEETPVDTIGWEYNPTTLDPLGVAFDGSDTNRILNPRGLGGTPGVVGSGGVMPTNWNLSAIDAALSVTYIGSGVESGWPYADFRIAGTPTTSNVARIASSTGSETWATGVPIAWAGAVRMIGGSLTGVSSTAVFRQTSPSASSVNLTLSGAKGAGSFIQTPATDFTGVLSPQYQLNLTLNTAIDISVRCYGIQCSRRPYAPAPVFPAVGASGVSARNQGSVSIPVQQLGTRWNYRQGILLIDWSSQPGPFASANDADWFGLASWGDLTADERMGILINPAHNTVQARLTAGGVVQTTSQAAISAPGAGVTTRAAVAWNLDAGFLQVAARGVAGSKVALTALPKQGFIAPGRFATSHPGAIRIQGIECRPAALFDASLATLT